MSKDDDKSIALVSVTSGRQLHISAMNWREKKAIEMGVSLSRIEAQKLAHALLEYAGAMPMRKSTDARKTVVTGTYRPDFREAAVVYYNRKR